MLASLNFINSHVCHFFIMDCRHFKHKCLEWSAYEISSKYDQRFWFETCTPTGRWTYISPICALSKEFTINSCNYGTCFSSCQFVDKKVCTPAAIMSMNALTQSYFLGILNCTCHWWNRKQQHEMCSDSFLRKAITHVWYFTV